MSGALAIAAADRRDCAAADYGKRSDVQSDRGRDRGGDSSQQAGNANACGERRRVVASNVRSMRLPAPFAVKSTALWFIIRGHGGRAIRAHRFLSGIRSLYDSLKLSAPPDAWHLRSYAPFET